MTTKEKKRALMHYSVWCARQRDIEEEIAELRLSQTSPAARIGDGMPHSHNPKGYDDYAAKLDELERKLAASKDASVTARINIEVAIESLKDPREKRAMDLHYIKGLTWSEVAEAMEYDVRHILRLHGSALQHIVIP